MCRNGGHFCVHSIMVVSDSVRKIFRFFTIASHRIVTIISAPSIEISAPVDEMLFQIA